MRRVFLFVVAIAFSTAVHAQDATVSQAADQVAKAEAIATEAEAVATEAQEVEIQIIDALMKDESLQKEAVNYLKENPETASSVAGILKANEGYMEGIITAVLANNELTESTVNYIKNNPEMLQTVMQLAGK